MHSDTDLTLACLIHDLNNMFQTLVEAGDVLSSDPRWAPLAATIEQQLGCLRSYRPEATRP